MAVRIEANAEPVPGYRLIERLGGGGFGEVWKCEAPGGLHKAIKFVFGSLDLAGDGGQRAEQELKALRRVATVRHPYILSLERYDIIDGQLIIIMELADRNLWDRFKECRTQGLSGIPRAELLGYMEEVAEALDLMNSQYQLQHLDVKPQNLFLVHNHVKVADFGLVKDMEGSQASVTGGITPVYAAPETFDGKVTRYSDQYSLAIVYQELLTGQRPFAGNNVRQLILQHLQGTPNLETLDAVERPIVNRALSKTPEERYPTCADFVRALRGGSGPEQVRAAPRVADELVIKAPPETPVSSRGGGPGRIGNFHDTPVSEEPPSRTRFIGVPSAESPSRPTQESTSPPPVSPPPVSPPPPSPPRTSPTPRLVMAEAASPGQREAEGDGALFPVLVIGVGGLGAQVLQSFRSNLGERFGTPEVLPNIRTLLIDTDPEVLKQLAQSLARPGSPSVAFPLLPADLLTVPLNRPSHYLRPQAGRVAVESWLNQRMLYRIPREQLTTSVRALGRLALFDHIRTIQRRIQMELEACCDPHALDYAAQATGLGVRSHRPRVYLIAGLMGGTGSGMFLDLAYLVRQLLRQLGQPHPEVTGILFVPQLDRAASRPPVPARPALATPGVPGAGLPPRPPSHQGTALATPSTGRVTALGNACAAILELAHFSRTTTQFTARYHEREPGLQDSAAPFTHPFLLPLPEDPRLQDTQEVLGMSARLLMAECASSFGRWRNSALPTSGVRRELVEPSCQTFGLYRITFPRMEIIRLVSQQCLRSVVERWASKDARPLEDQVREWVTQNWRGLDLGAEHFINRVQEACVRRLGKDPDVAFQQTLEILGQPGGTLSGASDARQGFLSRARAGGVLPPLDPDAVLEVLVRLEQMLGRPEIVDRGGGQFSAADWGAAASSTESTSGHGSSLTVKLPNQAPPAPGSLVLALREAATTIANEWSQKLAELPVKLIEQPAFRLAGAEEAIRQVVKTIEQVLERHEPLGRELADRAATAYGQVVSVLAQLNENKSWPRKGLTSENILERLRTYARSRYQALVLQQVLGVYVSLRGCLTDELREINFCRARLQEMVQLLSETGSAAPAGGALLEGRVRHLLPEGWENVDQAVARLRKLLTSQDLLELDGRLQKVIRSNFVALVHVCLSTKNMTRELTQTLRGVAFAFVEEKLGAAELARLFLQQFDQEQAQQELASSFEEAVPEPLCQSSRASSDVKETTVLGVPGGDSSQALAELAPAACPEGVPVLTTTEDDLIFYREWSELPLREIDAVSSAALEAYQQMLATEHFTPHTRCDIAFEPPSR